MRDTETTVIEMIRSRQELGINKYGTTVARNPLELRQWLQHSLEEKLDDCVYMMRAIQEIDAILQARSLPTDLFSPENYESCQTKTQWSHPTQSPTDPTSSA